MAFVTLTQGKIAILDDVDLPLVMPHRWQASRMGSSRNWYAVTTVDGTVVAMHRLILKLAPNVRCDHKNGNGLDNRRANLRPATVAQNAWNASSHSDNQSGYKGVSPTKYGTWIAQIMVQGKHYHLGTFSSAIEAAQIYNRAALHFYGEFARLNDVPED